jgi:hypothetical protein
MEALPPLRDDLPSTVEPFLNTTVPVGVGEVVTVPVTVTLNVTV